MVKAKGAFQACTLPSYARLWLPLYATAATPEARGPAPICRFLPPDPRLFWFLGRNRNAVLIGNWVTKEDPTTRASKSSTHPFDARDPTTNTKVILITVSFSR